MILTTTLNILRKNFAILLIVVLHLAAYESAANRIRCERPDYMSNGVFRLKRNFMRVQCNVGYQLQGLKTIECVRGKWDGEKPVCAKKGCPKNLETRPNGHIQIEGELKATLYCSDDYNLAGNRHIYCNGTHWDRPLGTCRERSVKVAHFCDFETEDICDWTYEPRANLEWKRVMATNVFTSFKTGPRHDHTTLTHNGGHYMLMESLVRAFKPVPLTSPIYKRELSLKTACCFQFYYFMYGAGVGDLLVVVKPLSVTLEEILLSRNDLIKFEKNGNQNNIWNEAYFSIEEMEEDFQIVFVAKSGHIQLSDIAVDDVRLLTGEDCKALEKTADDTISEEEDDATTYQPLFDIQSCVGRCYKASEVAVVRTGGHLTGLCGCNDDCEDFDSCCPDFKMVCANELFESTTVESPSFGSDFTEASKTVTTPVVVSPTESTTTTKLATSPKTTSTTSKTTSVTTKIPIASTTTPKPTTSTTKKLVPKTTPTTSTTTPKTSTTSTTTPTTSTTTPKTTTTTKITTARTTTTRKVIPTTRTTVRTTKATTTTTTTRRTTSTTTTRRTTPRTTTRRTTPTTTTRQTTPTTTTIKTTLSTPSSTTVQTTKSTAPATEHTEISGNSRIKSPTPKPRNESKSTVYVIDGNPKVEAAHRASSLLTYTFIVIVIILLSGAAYRRFSGHAAAWYMIHFRKHNGGDDETSSITTSLKRSFTKETNNKKTSSTKARKKTSYANDFQRPLVEDDDDDDTGTINGNIALQSSIYTEL